VTGVQTCALPISQKLLRQILGFLWLVDGLLQLQPQMFTMNMVNGIMKPILQSQPVPVASSLQLIIAITTNHLTVVNLLIAVVQIAIGLLLISGRWVKGTVIASIIWAFIVWFGGEGMSMLLTGQGSVLTGAPGAVLLYPLLGLAIYPRRSSHAIPTTDESIGSEQGTLSRVQLRMVLSGFWFFAALLQLQPYWWQHGQISQAIGNMVGQGGLNGIAVDPILQRLSDVTVTLETPLNSALILVFLGLAIALAVVKRERLRAALIASIVASLVIWYLSEALGMILTGMATDFNSGLLLVVMALACWPKAPVMYPARAPLMRKVQQTVSSAQSTSVAHPD